MVVAGAEATGGPDTLTVARGRFDGERAGSAFLAATPGASATQWRGSALWEGQGRAVALVTPRTLAQGDGQRVRGGHRRVMGDRRRRGRGRARRAAALARRGPEPTGGDAGADGHRRHARARGGRDRRCPTGLRRIGARLDLGADLNLEGAALFDSNGHAVAAASIWSETVRVYMRQPMVMLLGLGPVFQGMTVAAEGSRVHVRLHIGADKTRGVGREGAGGVWRRSRSIGSAADALAKQRRRCASEAAMRSTFASGDSRTAARDLPGSGRQVDLAPGAAVRRARATGPSRRAGWDGAATTCRRRRRCGRWASTSRSAATRRAFAASASPASPRRRGRSTAAIRGRPSGS